MRIGPGTKSWTCCERVECAIQATLKRGVGNRRWLNGGGGTNTAVCDDREVRNNVEAFEGLVLPIQQDVSFSAAVVRSGRESVSDKGCRWRKGTCSLRAAAWAEFADDGISQYGDLIAGMVCVKPRTCV